MQVLAKLISGVSIGFEIHDNLFSGDTKLTGFSIDLLIIRFMFIFY